MSALLSGMLSRCVRPVLNYAQCQSVTCISIDTCKYRARQSTRERKLKILRKIKARKAAQKLLMPIVPPKNVSKEQSKAPIRVTDEDRETCEDDVWFTDMYKFRVHTFQEAIQMHRESHDSSFYNDADAPVNAIVELNMTTDKLTKFHDNIFNVVPVKYPYKHGEERNILAFAKSREQWDEAMKAGATLAGGHEIIHKIKRGKIMLPDFEFVVSHPNVLTDLVVIRGLLKKKFPAVENGTLGPNLSELIATLREGTYYTSQKDTFDPTFAWVNVTIGLLNFPVEHLEDNLEMIMRDIKTKAPIRVKKAHLPFITGLQIVCPPSEEKLKVHYQKYIEEEEAYESDDDEDEKVARKVQNK